MRKYKVLVLCPSPKGTAATQRLKYEQYLSLLEEENFKFIISSFQTNRFWKIIYKPGKIPEKVFWTLFGYCKRIFDLVRAPFYDIIYVNLWVTPIGPPIFEFLLLFLNRNVLYDIDDMIFLSDKKNVIQHLKGRRKPVLLMQKARTVIVCTPKLYEKAMKLNKYNCVIDISSTLDTNRFKPTELKSDKNEIILGWTGTHSTLPFLESLQGPLSEIANRRKIKLLVIANRQITFKGISTEFRMWSETTEVTDLQQIDIGLYPIPENEWSLGKSGLKALTYMSIGIPVVATGIGANFRVVDHGITGYLVNTEHEWISRIIELIDDHELRRKMGAEGRKKVEQHFSVSANFPRYLQAFNNVINQ